MAKVEQTVAVAGSLDVAIVRLYLQSLDDDKLAQWQELVESERGSRGRLAE